MDTSLKTWESLKNLCEKSDRFQELTEEQMKKYKKEIAVAKRFYDNGRNLYEELVENQSVLKTQYAIPYILGLTEKLTDEPQEYVQVKPGASGGIDIDTDWQGQGRDKIHSYLVEKYGQEQVSYVGTFSTLGPASAAKDIMRVYGIDYNESNQLTKVLDKNLSWEDNIQHLKANNPQEYQIYLKHKKVLDLVPDFLNKIRQCLPWDQDVDIIDKYGTKTKKNIKFINKLEDYISYMDKDGKRQYTKNYDVFPSGKKKIFEITTSKGKKIRASANHKFFLKSGEVKELKDLNKDDEIIID